MAARKPTIHQRELLLKLVNSSPWTLPSGTSHAVARACEKHGWISRKQGVRLLKAGREALAHCEPAAMPARDRRAEPTSDMCVCAECGMRVAHPTAYHPYAACLMFKACRDARTVESNLLAVVNHGRRINVGTAVQ